ncbi:MAG: type III pantothenate kinase [Eubacteriales bacterium]|jgi:type III pantothenate kinase
MILAADIGNSNIVLGGLTDGKVSFQERIRTDRQKTAAEYAADIRNACNLHHVSAEDTGGAVLCSVVPEVTSNLSAAISDFTGRSVLTVTSDLDTGLSMEHMDSPHSVGTDLIVEAAGASDYYGTPVAVFDLGTASTCCVVDDKRNYIGEMIYPGIRISLDALSQRCSQLPVIDVAAPADFIAHNTVDSMKSGIIYSNAAIIDGMTAQIEEELGHPVITVVTGGFAGTIAPFCRKKIILDDELIMKGLYVIYQRNR